jgi:phosphoglycerol geranylgeranyltransferase
MNIYPKIVEKKSKNQKQFAVLIDPDKLKREDVSKIAREANDAGVDYFFMGGSLLTNNEIDSCIEIIKKNTHIPIVLFPGNPLQINANADAILFLSLISGRNAEMLIGHHVISAPLLKRNGLEVMSTGYMLIESGKSTTVSYMSNTTPIPSDKADVAACTAMAGEMLGLKLIFMDAGSGALSPIPSNMIKKVSQCIDVPLIIGGGIKTPEKAIENCNSGADVIVVGNSIEKDSSLIKELAEAIHNVSSLSIS